MLLAGTLSFLIARLLLFTFFACVGRPVVALCLGFALFFFFFFTLSIGACCSGVRCTRCVRHSGKSNRISSHREKVNAIDAQSITAAPDPGEDLQRLFNEVSEPMLIIQRAYVVRLMEDIRHFVKLVLLFCSKLYPSSPRPSPRKLLNQYFIEEDADRVEP